MREIDRIIRLPIAPKVSDAERDALSRRLVQALPYNGRCPCEKCRGRPFRLLPAQADGFHAFESTGSGFFSIKVGGGKTGLSQLIASAFRAQNPSSTILLLIPPSIFKQFWWRDLPWGRTHLSLSLPAVGLGDRDAKMRRILARDKRPGLYVMPYSLLSTQDTQELLREIDADLVICDEAQELAGDSAKTKRFWGWIDDRERQERPVRGVCMSGTLTTRTPMDYHRLIRWSLGENSPLPRPVIEATYWSNVLRSGAEDPSDQDADMMRPLLRWAEPRVGRPLTACVADVRLAYKERLATVPGYVSSGEGALGVGLEIRNTPAPGISAETERLMARVDNDGISPNGDLLKFGIEVHQALTELSAGFYSRRFWDETHPKVKIAKNRFAIDQDYTRALNEFFKSTRKPREGLDTPLLVDKWQSINGPVPGYGEMYDLWHARHEIDQEHEDLPERQSEPIRVDPYKVRAAVEWAASVRKGGIIWVFHRAIGEWVFEELAKAGLRPLAKGGGATWLENDGSEKFFCVASIEAHHAGKNLQHHTNQFVVQWPRPADYCEQMLGRTHRTGQRAERLIVDTCLTTEFDHLQMQSTLTDTAYQAETMGETPKLMIADWNPLPQKFDEDFLRLKGWSRGSN